MPSKSYLAKQFPSLNVERHIEYCFPFALAVISNFQGLEGVSLRPEGEHNKEILKEDLKRLYKICGFNPIEGSYPVVTDQHLRQLGYRTMFFENTQTSKELAKKYPDRFDSFNMYMPVDRSDIFHMDAKNFTACLDSALEQSPVMSLQFVEDEEPDFHGSIVWAKLQRHYCITDTYYCSGYDTPRGRITAVPIDEIQRTTINFALIEKAEQPAGQLLGAV